MPQSLTRIAIRGALAVVGFVVLTNTAMTAQRRSTANKLATSVAATLEDIERQHWDAYKRVDVAAHNAILTEDYVAIAPDGSVRNGKPTAKEIAATPIRAYSFENFQAATIAPRVELVTFIAEVEVPGAPSRFRFRVSELWIDRRGKWMQRFYHGTLLK